MEMNANKLEQLKSRVMRVKFTKKSTGEPREMICTQNVDIISNILGERAEPTEKTDKKKIKQNLNQIRVFDLEKCAWRSFDKDSVLEVTEQVA